MLLAGTTRPSPCHKTQSTIMPTTTQLRRIAEAFSFSESSIGAEVFHGSLVMSVTVMADHTDSVLRYLVENHPADMERFHGKLSHNPTFVKMEENGYPPVQFFNIICGIVSTQSVSAAETLRFITSLDLALFHSPQGFVENEEVLDGTLQHIDHLRLCRYVGLVTRDMGMFSVAEKMFELDDSSPTSKELLREIRRHRQDRTPQKTSKAWPSRLPQAATPRCTDRRPNLCVYCLKHRTDSRCGTCRMAFYCSSSCQKADWPVHKKTCLTHGRCLTVFLPKGNDGPLYEQE